MSESARGQATLADFWAISEGERFHELMGGELFAKAAPSGEHGDAQAGIVGAVRSPFQRPQGRGGPTPGRTHPMRGRELGYLASAQGELTQAPAGGDQLLDDPP